MRESHAAPDRYTSRFLKCPGDTVPDQKPVPDTPPLGEYPVEAWLGDRILTAVYLTTGIWVFGGRHPESGTPPLGT